MLSCLDSVVCAIMGQVCGSEYHVDKTASSFPFPSTNTCAILTFFNIEYTTWGFLCCIHKTLIRPVDLCTHIHNHEEHQPKGRAFQRSNKKTFLDHIVSSYGVHDLQSNFPLPVFPCQALPGLDPFLAIPCPISGCKIWHRDMKSMDSHLQQKHGKEAAKKYASWKIQHRYILKPYWSSISQENTMSWSVLEVEWASISAAQFVAAYLVESAIFSFVSLLVDSSGKPWPEHYCFDPRSCRVLARARPCLKDLVTS